MEEDQNFNIALFKYLSGQANYQEARRIREWLSASKKNRREFDLIRKHYDNHNLVFNSEEVRRKYENFLSRVDAENSRPDISHYLSTNRSKKNSYSRIAAAVLVLITAVFMLWGISVLDNTYDQNFSGREETFFSQTVPGQKSRYRLPDGSKVWLNSGSSISFAKQLTDSIREVSITGEGYFEVTHDPKRPFIVKTPRFQTEVLGTSFNICTYESESLHRISLVTGKIKVTTTATGKTKASLENTFVLNPGYELSLDDRNGQIVERAFNIHAVISWKEGTLVFEGDTYDNMVSKLERWYGIKIESIGQVPDDFVVTGEFINNENLVNVLESIRFGRKFDYDIKQNNVKIIFD